MKKIVNFFYKNNIGISILTSLIIFLLITIVAIINRFAPFGNNSFATMDANIQYVDFFAYLKDVLQSKNTINTLSATLGNNSIGIISYYLTSPFNILILFFSKANIQNFFNIIVCLKLAVCGFTFSYYLQKRFDNKIHFVFISKCCANFANTRVSSAATKSASRKTSIARGDISDKFPIGVPTTYSPDCILNPFIVK